MAQDRHICHMHVISIISIVGFLRARTRAHVSDIPRILSPTEPVVTIVETFPNALLHLLLSAETEARQPVGSCAQSLLFITLTWKVFPVSVMRHHFCGLSIISRSNEADGEDSRPNHPLFRNTILCRILLIWHREKCIQGKSLRMECVGLTTVGHIQILDHQSA
jgi:hypothetical protein